VYAGVLQRADLQPGETVVDIGTGRGELLAVAVERGAARALGLEYAEAAIDLARKTLETHSVGGRAGVLVADARAIPVRSESADLVTMIDVVEHLAPRELDLTLREALRILRPGGRIIIHTMPSRTIYSVTYRLLRLARPRRWRTWPADPRNEYERTMHVNEQTVTTLGRSLRRAGFRPYHASLGQWVYTVHIPEERAKRVYRALARMPLLARLGVGDIWGEGVRPPSDRPAP
jgi:ubiquinone/menaquinone biosynthesis C-methylase UbiE